jgi:hypothetical protein
LRALATLDLCRQQENGTSGSAARRK